MILSLFLAVIAPTDFGVSALVEDSHDHDWEMLSEFPTHSIHWDRNSTKLETIRGHDYPSVLIRFVAQKDDLSLKFEDRLLAFDCDQKLQAIVSKHANIPLPPRIITGGEPLPRFTPVSDEGVPVMEIACTGGAS